MGKKILKQFEPRMAHSAIIMDQFVVLFGGLNKTSSKKGTLISNDMFVLSLNGITNAILSKKQTQYNREMEQLALAGDIKDEFIEQQEEEKKEIQSPKIKIKINGVLQSGQKNQQIADAP